VPLVLQLPWGTEGDFTGVIDIVQMKGLLWANDDKTSKGDHYDVVDIPAEYSEQAEEYRTKLIETLADVDDATMEKYLEGEETHRGEIKAWHPPRHDRRQADARPVRLRVQEQGRAAHARRGRALPALAARRRRRLGHAVNDEEKVLERAPEGDAPLSTLAFKIMSDPHLGKLTYLRIYSGTLTSGSQVLNSTKGNKERIGKIYRMHANKREEIERAAAGSIVAVMGLKNTTTGDTLCGPEAPIILESMNFPAPVISVAIEPKTKSDQEKLGTAIQRLAEEDPTFQVRTDEETNQTIISGMGELHLEVLVDRMRREFKVEANVGKPQVAYRETVRRKVEKVDYTHKKQTGWLRPVRQGADRPRADGRAATAATSSSTPSPVAASRRSTSLGRRGMPGGDGVRRARRLPARRRQGDAAGRPVPRGRLLRARLQDRRLDGLQGGRAARRPGAPRADDGCRGHDAR
jgi:elongation factor G